MGNTDLNSIEPSPNYDYTDLKPKNFTSTERKMVNTFNNFTKGNHPSLSLI